MRFSRTSKSSSHSIPSPDGTHIATVIPSKLVIRTTRGLEPQRTISLQENFSNSIQWLLWSESSQRVLVASSETIKIFSVEHQRFSATITNPTSGVAKITHLAFGAHDGEVLVFSEFGLKATVFKLTDSTSVELVGPKLFTAGTATQGLTYRPESLHCAFLTRTGGKDVVSVHARDSYEVVRSWNPDTVDAQALSWSADGRWLAVVESAGQGHGVSIYTADGHLYKKWRGPVSSSIEEKDIAMGAGVRLLQWSPKSNFLAVGDYSSNVTTLSVPQFTFSCKLQHTSIIQPTEDLQIYQEQVIPSQLSRFTRQYNIQNQPISPPTTEAISVAKEPDPRSGTTILTISQSGVLAATKQENMPTTLFIWDIATGALKQVLIQHSPISKVTWHPSMTDVLLITSEGVENRGLVHVWSPTFGLPKIVDFAALLPEGKVMGKVAIRWLGSQDDRGVIFWSDTQDFMLGDISGRDGTAVWDEEVADGEEDIDVQNGREESPLDLIPADESGYGLPVGDRDESFGGMSQSHADDTFQFRKHV